MVPMNGLWVLPLIALFSTIVLIYFVYLRAQRNTPALIWILMLFFFLLWTVGEFAQKWLGQDIVVLKWMVLCIIFGDIFPAIFLVFTLMFPTPNELFMKYQKVLLIVIIVPKIISTIITLSNPDFSKPGDWDEFWSGSNLGYYPFVLALKHIVFETWWFIFGLAHTMVLLSIGAFVLIWNYWKSEFDAIRYWTRVILIGLAIYLIIGASTGFILPIMG